jgi:P-type conjugative transfer protein TrbJ
MEAAASQMDSLPAEQARLQSLEARNGTAIGNLEVAEVGNEASIQNAQNSQKLRELMAGMINAQAVAESNRLNEEVYSQQTSLAIKTAPWQGDYTHNAPQPIHLYGRN